MAYGPNFGMMALSGAMLALGLIVGVALYVYIALAWSTIAKKLKHDTPWLAWIPFANIALILQLGNFHWAWVFLLLIPILGWIALPVLGVISLWRIYEKRNYPGALSLIWIGSFIPFLSLFAMAGNLIIFGLVAWSDRK